MSIDYLLNRYKKSGTDWLQESVPADGSIEERLLRGSRLARSAVGPEALIEQIERMHLLYEITSKPGKPVGQQLAEALALATRVLRMELGIISHIAGERYTIEQYFPPEAPLMVGQVFPLSSTFCERTMKNGAIVAIENAKKSRSHGHPYYSEYDPETYIGSVILVRGRPYGTLNFSSSWPQTRPFTAVDSEFVEMLARWVGSLIEQRESSARHKIKEARFQSLVDNMEEIFWMNDPEDGKIIYINHAVEKITGYTPERLMKDSESFLARQKPKDREGIIAALMPRNDGKIERKLDDEIRITHIDGTTRDVLVRSRPLYDHRQILLAQAGFALDITERKKAERVLANNLKRMSALYNVSTATIQWHSMPDLLEAATQTIAEVLPADRVTIITFDVEKEQTIHFAQGGKGQENVIRVPYEELMSGLSGWVIETGRPALSPKDVPDWRENPDVRQRRVDTNCGAIIVVPIVFQEQILGTMTAINRPDERDFIDVDVDLMVTISNQLAVVLENSRLYDREKCRVTELEQANKELDDFAQTVAHDLKTPLGLVMGFTQLLDPDNLGVKDNQDMIDMIVRQSKNMNNIIDEILFLASVRQADVEVYPLEMPQLLENVCSRLTLMVKQSEAEISWPEEWPNILGYGPWVEEVWANYISNAIKYGGTPPKIELGWTAQDDGLIRCWVRDHGPGLTLEAQEKLFEQFERADQTRIEGQGLGLSIVKRIINKLNGDVAVSSQPGKGATFSFTLPAVSQPTEEPAGALLPV